MDGLTLKPNGKITYNPKWMRDLKPYKPIRPPKPRESRSLDVLRKAIERRQKDCPRATRMTDVRVKDNYKIDVTCGATALLTWVNGGKVGEKPRDILAKPPHKILLTQEVFLPLRRAQIFALDGHMVVWKIRRSRNLALVSFDNEYGRSLELVSLQAPAEQPRRLGLDAKAVLDVMGCSWPLWMHYYAKGEHPNPYVMFRPESDAWRYVVAEMEW